MALGVTAAVVDGWLASFSAPWVALHIGDPGATGTANPSAGSATRLAATMSTPTDGVTSIVGTTGPWTNGGATETLSHVSLWSAASAGNFLGSSALTTSVAWSSAGRFTLSALTITIEAITGNPPSAPLNVTSITADAAADVSWYAPSSSGDSAITHYLITPYNGATPLSTTTVAVAATTAVSDSYGTVARRYRVTGLTNGTAYTFKVAARNTQGDGPDSVASGANTPFANLVFGDDFNGPVGARPDPEWWVYDRCGYLAQNEVAWYKQSHCVLDGAGSLKVTAERINTAGPRYPSDPSYPGTITQPWRSGACQGNTRLFYPGAGNSMTFEARFQVNPTAGDGYWPGFFWLEGQEYIEQWKTDPRQDGWNSTTRAEIDIAEWYQTGSPNSYGNVSWAGTNEGPTGCLGDGTLHTQMHTYSCIWTPGTSVVFKRDGVTTATHTNQVPASGAQFFLMIYLQMLSTGSTATESCYVDYVRVYEN